MSRRLLDSDSGETLIESVISVLIMSLAVVAVVGAIGVGSILSGGHRDDASADLDLKSAIEQIKTLAYIPQAPSGAYASAAGLTLTAGEVQTARCWDGLPTTLPTPGSWPACAPSTPDGGLQLLELVMETDGRAEAVAFIMREKPVA